MSLRTDSVSVLAFRYAVPVSLIVLVLALQVSSYPWLALLPGIGVLFLLWIARNNLLAWLFYGFVMLIPFGSFRSLGGDLSFLRLHWVFAVSLTIFVGVRMVLMKRVPDEVRSPEFWGIMALFYIVNIISMLMSRVMESSVPFVILLGAGYLLVALGMILVDRNGFRVTLPAVVMGSVFVSSLLAIAGSVFGVQWFVSAESGRVLGGAPDPNNMALMIIFSLPFAVYFLLTAERVPQRLFFLLVVVLDIVAVIATFSRGGALVMILTVGLLMREYKSMLTARNLGPILGAAGMAVVLLLVLTPESYRERIGSIKTADDFAMRRRLSYLFVARDLVAARPLLGNGPDSYPALYAKTETGRIFRRKLENGEREAHNTYVEVVTGSGLVGLSLFLALLVYALRSFSKARQLFDDVGDVQAAFLVRAYRASYISLLVYLLIYSEVCHKYLLLSLAMSQVAQRQAFLSVKEQEAEYAAG